MTKKYNWIKKDNIQICEMSEDDIQDIYNKLKASYFVLAESKYFRINKKIHISVKCNAKLSDKCRETLFIRIDHLHNTMCVCCIQNNPDKYNKIKKTCREKYGVENPMQVESIKNKLQHTNLKKYGSITPFGNKKIQDKIKQTCLEKYGYENPFNDINKQNQIKQTKINKYGTPYYTQTQEYLAKTKQTNLDRYGVEYYLQSTQNRQTNLERYGVEHYLQSDEGKKKAKQSMLESGYMYSDEVFLELITRTKPHTSITDVKRIKGIEWEFTHLEHGKWRKKCTNGIDSVHPHKIDQFLFRLKDSNPNFHINQLDNHLYEITNSKLTSISFITKELKQTYEFDQHFFPEKRINNLLYKLTYHYQNSPYSFNLQDIESKYSCVFSQFQEHINYKFVEYYQHPLHECTEKEYESLQLDHSIPQQFFKKNFPQNWEKLANHYTNVKYLKNLNMENQKKSDKYFFNELEVFQWYNEGNIKFPDHLYDFREERKIIFN